MQKFGHMKIRNFIGLVCTIAILGGVASLYNNGVRQKTSRLINRGIDYATGEVLPLDDAIKHKNPLAKKLANISWNKGSKVFIRIFKQDHKLELFGQHHGKWVLLKSYDICKWSGKLGPKFYEGDRQAPEGFYNVSAKQLNPNSRHHLSFNLGFPNQVDRAQGKTGSFLMVHGGCSSIGCYAITDSAVDEVYKIVEEALKNGQQFVAVHAFPFHLTKVNLQKHKANVSHEFWQTLKPGYIAFEEQGSVPKVLACNTQYGFAYEGQKIANNCSPLKGW